jgi:hypothetical protein
MWNDLPIKLLTKASGVASYIQIVLASKSKEYKRHFRELSAKFTD